MFNVGDRVVYHHVVCTVTAYEKEFQNGEDYLGLQAVFKESLKYHLPVRSCEKLLRPVITKADALHLIDSMVSVEPLDSSKAMRSSAHGRTPVSASRMQTTSNHKLADEYKEYFASNDIEDMVPLLKMVYQHIEERNERGKAPTSADREFFSKIEGIMNDELSIALNIERDEIEDFVIQRIESKGHGFAKRA